MSYALAVRIPAGKTEFVRRLFADSLGPEKAAYDDLQRRAGLTEEAYWLQSDPDGDLFIVVSNRDQAAFMAIMANPQTDYERRFRDRLQEAFGFDASAPPGPANERLGTWSAQPVGIARLPPGGKAVLVLRHLAEEFGAMGALAGDDVVEVVDGDHDPMPAQRVGRRVLRLGADRRGGVVRRQLQLAVAIRRPQQRDGAPEAAAPRRLGS